jgi:hypothetical protein
MIPWRRPRFAIGEEVPFLLEVDDHLLNTVAYLCQVEESSPGITARVPRASGFFVAVPEDAFPGLGCSYLVTARHCIEETKRQEFYVRFNANTGRVDEPSHADSWFKSDDADVAAVPMVSPTGSSGTTHTAIAPDIFVQADYAVDAAHFVPSPSRPRISVAVGHDVIFVSLFVQHPGELVNLPVVRFGHISRMPGEAVRFARSADTYEDHIAYLVECHSWGGHSGAPVFWRYPYQVLEKVQGVTVPVDHELLGLLGLVSGHFDIEKKATVEGDILGTVTAEINAGMALVTPAQAIKELLTREDVVADRKKRLADADAKKPAATFDSGFTAVAEESEFDRFENLTRKLAKVSKKELDEQRKQEKS